MKALIKTLVLALIGKIIRKPKVVDSFDLLEHRPKLVIENDGKIYLHSQYIYGELIGLQEIDSMNVKQELNINANDILLDVVVRKIEITE
jgi:hypothetical protein